MPEMVSRMRRPCRRGILMADSLLLSWRMRIVRALADHPLQSLLRRPRHRAADDRHRWRLAWFYRITEAPASDGARSSFTPSAGAGQTFHAPIGSHHSAGR